MMHIWAARHGVRMAKQSSTCAMSKGLMRDGRPRSRVLRLRAGNLKSLLVLRDLLAQFFFPPDGRLAWAVIEQDNQSAERVTRVEAFSSQGTLSTLRTIPGSVDHLLASPDGSGLYWPSSEWNRICA